MVIIIGKGGVMFEILIAIVLMGVALIYFVCHPIKTLKWISIGIAVIMVGTFAWAMLFAGLLALSTP
jgi:hypothetical protein